MSNTTPYVIMEGLRIRGQRKLHWNAEDPKRRTVIAGTVARLPAMHLVVVRTDAAATVERRRRKCLEILLPELERAKVDRVYLEAREKKQNQRDVQLLAALRAQQVIGSGWTMCPDRASHCCGSLTSSLEPSGLAMVGTRRTRKCCRPW
jgi:hypothetical protein